MEIVARWTGRHGLAIAEAMRLPREEFARQLGISPRTMADWAKQPGMPLALRTQELLDVVLGRGSEAVRLRFAELLHPAYWPNAPVAAPTASGDLIARATAYQGDLVGAVDLLTGLTTADLGDQLGGDGTGWIKTAVAGAIAGYLFSGASPTVVDAYPDAGPAARIRSVAKHLMDLDFELGGGVVRSMLLAFFRTEVTPLLRRAHSEQERREIFTAAAEVAQLLGWSAYDAGAHGAAQGYYTLGLRLAQEAGDRRVAAYLLSDLSHQANYLGHFPEALQLARAAQSAGDGWAKATQTTAALAMEARALASLGERRQCLAVISKAEQTFEQHNPAVDPAWMCYFTADEFAGELLHCFAGLGMAREAQESSRRALAPLTPARTRVLVELVSARSVVLAGDLDVGIELAGGVLSQADAVASIRCQRYVADFQRVLVDGHGKDPRVKTFLGDLRRDYPKLARAS